MRKETAILIGVQTPGSVDVEASLKELSFLAETAGAETVGIVIQNREAPHPGTYIGKGKIDEVNDLLYRTGADCVICDDELSPVQMRNLEDQFDVKVLDRTILILDIFASRASTAEGRIQVELAQARYTLTRLSGFGKNMSRLGGGIGTRGPGESKLETDRRRIRDRVTHLKQELKNVVRQREVTRASRVRNRIPVVAIVGYTNAGKSTLLNTLTGAGVLSEDKLFATLDPTTRSLSLPHGETVLLTDTVGFIHKLPHHLIDAFRSTLEEARYADIIVHVADASDPELEHKMSVVYRTLNDLNVSGKPIITLYNKCDRELPSPPPKDPASDVTLRISAKTGYGLQDFLDNLEQMLGTGKVQFEMLFPFSEAGRIQLIRKYGQLLSEEYTEEGIKVTAVVPKEVERMFIPAPKEDWEE